ncbi:hypothetical protein QYE76_021035 [Lolium multiflorum]|uniref:Uncharacterized protein n=1 Tax=Lolium multiflorum TaxID=4521 RepID=A0AAD8R5W4_LOLMU|nr:hypothetical protein QYE76_021035 [Lolium multiflorum]
MAELKWSLGMMPFEELMKIAEERAKREKRSIEEQMAKGWRPQLSEQGIEEQIVAAQAMLDLRDPDDPMRKMARQGLEDLEEML